MDVFLLGRRVQMIKIAVVEDEEEYRRKIAGYIKKFSEDNELPIQVVEFKDGIDIVNNYKPLYDLIFLDIQMKNLDGIKAAEIIRKYDKDVIIIFITNNFEVNPVACTCIAIGIMVCII